MSVNVNVNLVPAVPNPLIITTDIRR